MKFRNTTDEDMTIRGVSFPPGKSVTVEDAALTTKLRGIPALQEVKKGRKANDKNTS